MKIVVACALVLAAVPATARAAWPVGGDPGRSGASAEAIPGPPFRLAGRLAGEPVRTPLLITAAGAAAWGTDEGGGTVQLRPLDGGAPAGAVDIDDEPSLATQPPAFGARLGFVSSSSRGAPGMLTVVHADGGGLEVAQIDERTGVRTGPDVRLPAGNAATIGATPLLAPPDAAGTRALLFTTYTFETDSPRLWRVPIRNAGTERETVDAGATRTRNMDPTVSVPLAMARIGGADHVVVANQNRLFTFSVADLAPGPQSDPVGEAGNRLDHVTVAPDGAIFAVAAEGGELLRLVPEAGKLRRTAARRLGASPAGLAVAGGRLLAGSGASVATFDAATLAPLGTVDLAGVPSVAGELVFGTRAQRPASASAPLPDADLGAVVGRPALGAGAVVFPAERGVAVYRGEPAPASAPAPPRATPRARVALRRLRGRRVRLTVRVAPCRPGRVRVVVRSPGRRRVVMMRVGRSCVARRVVRAGRPARASARYLG